MNRVRDKIKILLVSILFTSFLMSLISAASINTTSYLVNSTHLGTSGTGNISTASYQVRDTITYQQASTREVATVSYTANSGWFTVIAKEVTSTITPSTGGGSGGGSGSGGGGGGGGTATLTTLTKIFGQGGKIVFKVDGEIHSLEIIEITNTDVTINISSAPQQAVLSIGEEKKFEINDDEFYDILVRLNGIDNKNANITIFNILTRQSSEAPLDINLDLLDYLIQDISGLVAIINFENSRKEQINVNFLFTLLDEDGKEVYAEDGSVTVERNEILRKSFENVDIDLKEGKYALVLTVIYDLNVVDEFRQDFEIGRERAVITGGVIEFIQEGGNLWIVVIGLFILGGLVWWLIKKQRKSKEKKQRGEVEMYKKSRGREIFEKLKLDHEESVKKFEEERAKGLTKFKTRTSDILGKSDID